MTNGKPPILGARAHDYAGATPGELFQKIAADGFQAVQLATQKSFGWGYPLTHPQCLEICQALEESKLFIAVLGCYVNVVTADDTQNAKAVDTFIGALNNAVLLGAACVGTETTHFEGDGAARKTAFDRLTDSVKRMVEAAEEIGAIVGIEPVTAHVLNSPDLTYQLLHRVHSKHMKIIFDPSNLLRHEDVHHQAEYLERCEQAFGDQVIALHVKDAVIQDDYIKPSRPLFEGELDWPLYFRWAKTKAALPLLREEAIPARAKEEIIQIKQWIGDNA